MTTGASGGQKLVSELIASDFSCTGLPTATSGGRWVGTTASGAPTSTNFTFIAGDFINTLDGHFFICTVGGSPGTWVDPSAGGAITNVSGNLPSDVTMTANVTTTIMSTSSLATGKWLVYFGVTFATGASTHPDEEVDVVVGTATATFTGQQSCEVTGNTSQAMSASIQFIANVTVAGTLTFQAHNNSATIANTAKAATPGGGAFPQATGYTALKIG